MNENTLSKNNKNKERKVIKLAEKSQSSFSWSCEDALERALEDVRNGKISPEKLMIHFFEKDDPGDMGKTGFYTSNMTVLEHIGLLEVSKLQVINEGL